MSLGVHGKKPGATSNVEPAVARGGPRFVTNVSADYRERPGGAHRRVHSPSGRCRGTWLSSLGEEGVAGPPGAIEYALDPNGRRHQDPIAAIRPSDHRRARDVE